MNGSLAATAEPSWLSGRGLLWLYLLVPLCTLRAPSSSSWGAGHWGHSGDPTLSTHQRIHIRGNGWEHPRMQEQCQGAGDARLCQVSARGLLGSPLPLKNASFDTSGGVMDAPRFAALCARLLPHPWAGIEASRSWPGPGGIYLHWQDWESVIKLSIAKRPLRRGGRSPPPRGLTSLFPSHSAGRAASASGVRTRLPVRTVLTKPPGAQAA